MMECSLLAKGALSIGSGFSGCTRDPETSVTSKTTTGMSKVLGEFARVLNA